MLKNKKILLIAPYNQHSTGARQLASVLLEKDYLAKVLVFKKMSAPNPSHEEMDLLATYLKNYQPDFIGISLTSFTNIKEKIFFAFLKEHAPKAILACGGFGPTFETKRFLDAGIDYVLRGEGEGIILDIARALHTNEDIKSFDNVSYFDENKNIIDNPLRPLIEDLDTIPPYLHGDEHISIIDDNSIRHCDPMLVDEKMYLATTSRGCLGKCTYCSGGNWLEIYKKQFGKVKRYRTRSVEHIMQELEKAKANGAIYIHFFDEYFVRPEKEFFKFFTEIKERIGLPFSLMVHSVFLMQDKKRIETFFQSGIWYVEIGVQTANEHISRNIFRRPVSTAHQLKTLKLFYEKRICSAVDIITAHALESEEAYRDTLEFIKALPYDPSWPRRIHLQVFRLGLFPGAPIGDMFPLLKEEIIPKNTVYHRILMAYLRHYIKDDTEFFSYYNDTSYLENPKTLYELCHSIYNREQELYWQKTIKRLENKEVYFWACGSWYQENKEYFKNTKARAILVNTPHEHNESMDGLKIVHSDEILPQNKNNPLPIIVFGRNAPRISQYILKNYPEYTDIITSCKVVAQLPNYTFE